MNKTRVLVADESEFMQVLYKRILETQEHIEVVGTVAESEEALREVDDLEPDVAIIDVKIPKTNGIVLAQSITSTHPNTGIVVISYYDDTEYVVELLRGRPEGKAYLLRASVDKVAELIRAVGAVAAGQTVLDTAIVDRLSQTQAPLPESPLSQLIDGERRVLALIAEGYTDNAIAGKLGTKPQTVQVYADSIYQKLNLAGEPENRRRGRAVLAFVTDRTPVSPG